MAGVHPATIRRWIKAGRLMPHPSDNPSLLLLRRDIEALLDEHRS